MSQLEIIYFSHKLQATIASENCKPKLQVEISKRKYPCENFQAKIFDEIIKAK